MRQGDFAAKIVQVFPLTFFRQNGIINHKFISPAMKKRSICGCASESRRFGVRRRAEAEKGALEQRTQEWADAESANEGGTAEDYDSFRPLLCGKR